MIFGGGVGGREMMIMINEKSQGSEYFWLNTAHSMNRKPIIMSGEVNCNALNETTTLDIQCFLNI